MNTEDRQELERLKWQQRLLQGRLTELEKISGDFEHLSRRIAELERRIEAAPAIPAEEEIPPVTPLPTETKAKILGVSSGQPKTKAPSPVREELPPILPTPSQAAVAPRPASISQPPPTTASVPASKPPVHPAPPLVSSVGKEQGSFEMRLGTYWFVRVGIVMVLTALVFLANLAYKNWIVSLGPGGKVLLLYFAGGILLGVGAWLYRGPEKLRNYAQVLVAGGLAEVYFTTYAAYHFPFLRVIESPVVDALLLLIWAAFIVALADWKKSELLALFAIVLSYYTAVITRVGYFTLCSNLVLAIAATFFLLRNRWAHVSFISLMATYASYGFWRFFTEGAWHWASPEQGLGQGAFFLGCYWIIFTVAVFACRDASFAGQKRASFLTMNNGAALGLFLLTMAQVRTGGFWKVCLIFGTLLLGLFLAAQRLLAKETLAQRAYLIQGLLLVTLGFITYFTGGRLAVILAMESAGLLLFSRQWNNKILHYGALVCGALAACWAVSAAQAPYRDDLVLAIICGALLAFNAWYAERSRPETAGETVASNYFSILALLIWAWATWRHSAPEWRGLALAGEGLVLTLTWPLLRTTGLTVFGQGLVLLGQVQVVWASAAMASELPWWCPAGVLGITLLLSHWWQKHQNFRVPEPFAQMALALYALALVAVLSWLRVYFGPESWLAFCSLLAVIVTAYGLYTRLWLLAACGQLFLLASIINFARQVMGTTGSFELPWYYGLAPLVVTWGLSGAVLAWCDKRNDTIKPQVLEGLNQAAIGYRAIGVLLVIAWVAEYVSPRNRFWVFVALNEASFASALLSQRDGRVKPGNNIGWLVISGVFMAIGFAQYWFLPAERTDMVYWPNLLSILFVGAQQHMARQKISQLPEAAHTAVIVVTVASLWLFVSQFVKAQSGGVGFFLTAAWAGLAFVIFIAGFILRERMHRWMGLALLAAALGRVIVLDVWHLETIYRIISFLALGIVLLVLGFIYNKYQEKIRQWL